MSLRRSPLVGDVTGPVQVNVSVSDGVFTAYTLLNVAFAPPATEGPTFSRQLYQVIFFQPHHQMEIP